jgi:hypothetical protein
MFALVILQLHSSVAYLYILWFICVFAKGAIGRLSFLRGAGYAGQREDCAPQGLLLFPTADCLTVPVPSALNFMIEC